MNTREKEEREQELLAKAGTAARKFMEAAQTARGTGMAAKGTTLTWLAADLRAALDALVGPADASTTPPAPEDVLILEGIVQQDRRCRGMRPIITDARGLYVNHRVLATFKLPLPKRLLIPEIEPIVEARGELVP